MSKKACVRPSSHKRRKSHFFLKPSNKRTHTFFLVRKLGSLSRVLYRKCGCREYDIDSIKAFSLTDLKGCPHSVDKTRPIKAILCSSGADTKEVERFVFVVPRKWILLFSRAVVRVTYFYPIRQRELCRGIKYVGNVKCFSSLVD